MKQLALLLFIFAACNEKTTENTFKPVDWHKRTVATALIDSLYTGSTYLSVYSEIYEMTEETTHQLTATVSIRNISTTDSVFITAADYYNTKGNLLRSYLDEPIFVAPLETIEIIIYKKDTSGGTGANFIFNWAAKNEKDEPFFEAVMVWTTGHQGISFVTTGVRR